MSEYGVTGQQALTVLALLLGLLLGAAGAWFLAARNRSWRGGRIHDRGRRAEASAQKLLAREGFSVTAVEPRLESRLLVNGEPHRFETTPDFLARKNGQTYVVEVKRRKDGKGVANASARRQALEYIHASSLPCLLVIMPAGVIELIERDRGDG